MSGVRLVWDGKDAPSPKFRLPLQVVETVNAGRADDGAFTFDQGPDDGWRNKLIWGDNLHVLRSLADELAGQVDLIYIDPPFDSRQDYKVRIAVGDGKDGADQDLFKLSSMIEEKAYRDTWGRGVESYLQMLYERLVVLRELLSERGSIFLHLAPNVSHLARVMLDEIFGQENFRAEIIWQRTVAHADTKDFGTVHDSILAFSKSALHLWNPQHTPYDETYMNSHDVGVDIQGRKYRMGDLTGAGTRRGETGQPWRGFDPDSRGRHWANDLRTRENFDAQGRIHWPAKGGFPRLKRFFDEMPGNPVGDVWTDIGQMNAAAKERMGYDTQKPEALLERVIKSSSDEGSIVLDCFVGSGTTASVAEKLKRRWVAVDMGRFAIHTTRKRLLDIPGCTPFTVSNLGSYERQAWQEATTGEQVQAYLDFIVQLYGAASLEGFQHLHGVKGPCAIHVGAVDAPVGLGEIKEALDEAVAAGHPALDVLGWDFDLGLHELVEDEASGRGIRLRLRRIPNDVMDQRAVQSGEIVFHELAYLDVVTKVDKKRLTVTLADFVLPNPELIPAAVQKKITGWADYVDYWAVDFDFSDDTFHNQWQSFRTRADRSLTLTTDHHYDKPGTYTVLVKAVDIFGNDTTVSKQVVIA